MTTPLDRHSSPTRSANSPLPTPTRRNGVGRVMHIAPQKSRQPTHTAWSRERLISEHAIALGYALDTSTLQTYNLHLQSYLSF